VDGRGFRALWDDFADKLFQYADSDGRGSLDAHKVALLPPASALFNRDNSPYGLKVALLNQRGGPPAAGPTMKDLDTDGDGKVSKAELSAYYRKASGGAFRVLNNGGGGRGPQTVAFSPDGRLVAANEGGQADRINDAFFRILDVNGDGRLSAEELAAAPQRLLHKDLDDDEMITIAELLGEATTPGVEDGAFKFVLDSYASMGGGQPDSSFLTVDPGDRGEALAKELLKRYGTAKGKEPAKALTREQIGLSREEFDRLDANKDGLLDAAELAAFLTRGPDLELTVNIAAPQQPQQPQPLRPPQQPGKPAKPGATATAAQAQVVPVRLWDADGGAPTGVSVTLTDTPERKQPLADAVKKLPNGGLLLTLGRTRLELGAPNAGGPGGMRAPGRVVAFRQQPLLQQYLAEFRRLDTAGVGYLDEKTAANSPLYRGTFKLMDRKGEGKVFEKDVRDYVERTGALEAAAAQTQLTLSVADKGNGLFDLVDENKDGRLSVREMRGIAKKFAALGRDGVSLARNEVPRDLSLGFSRGGGGGNVYGNFIVARTFGGPAQAQPEGPRKGPVWFQKMDRNRDGDVSRKEWLGTEEEFRKIDTDGDGLISWEEAEAYDKLMRQAAEKQGR
jgi:Ca2+-binding EF-hand superfamily protein